MQPADNSDSFQVEEEDGGAWVLTYADLVTLLLVFFILLFSISTMNLQKFKYAIQSIQENLGEEKPPIALKVFLEEQDFIKPDTSLEEVTGLRTREDEMLEDFNTMIRETNLGNNILLQSAKEKIRLLIIGAVLFTSGQAVFHEDARPILNGIVKIVQQYPEYQINIQGHTDNLPIKTRQFPSNWELSSIRATTVLKYLIQKGVDPNRLTATGYADVLPIAPNDTEENRTKNRRVEFVLEKKGKSYRSF